MIYSYRVYVPAGGVPNGSDLTFGRTEKKHPAGQAAHSRPQWILKRGGANLCAAGKQRLCSHGHELLVRDICVSLSDASDQESKAGSGVFW